MLSEDEEQYIEEVIEACEMVGEEPFELMMEEGVPADAFINPVSDYTFAEVLESLEEKDLAYTESVQETIHYLGDPMGEPLNMKESGYKTVERQYIYFTEELEDLYRE